LHAGLYELDLLTYDGATDRASVTLRTSSRLTDPLVLKARGGLRSDVVQRARDPITPTLQKPTPMYPYSGGFYKTMVDARQRVPAVVIDQMTIDASATPGMTMAGVVEFCRSFDAAACETEEFVSGEVTVGSSRITMVEGASGEEEVARIGWDLVGQPDTWRVRNALLWVDLNPGSPLWAVPDTGSEHVGTW
jgi:hypothetical protein